MNIVVTGRHTDINDRFRELVDDKLARLEQLAPHAQRIDVQVTRDNSVKVSQDKERVEITVLSKGPVIRAEANAEDRYAALDIALGKISERLRRAKDRRTSRHNRAAQNGPVPQSVPMDVLIEEVTGKQPVQDTVTDTEGTAAEQDQRTFDDSPITVRDKTHEAVPMSVRDAIDEMELVGHDFFLFIDEETSEPAVVYRRRGWTYGVIRLTR